MEPSVANSNVKIRRAQADDGAAILALIQALADFEKLPAPDEDAQQCLLADAFGEHPRFEIFVADCAGKVAGYAFIFETYSTFLARPTLYLEDLFVLPDYRQQQVGHLLFRFCAKEAVRRGCGRMEWTVLDWNTKAIQFYQRHGASHLNEWLHYRLDAEQLAGLVSGG